jgi:hypothetical protein
MAGYDGRKEQKYSAQPEADADEGKSLDPSSQPHSDGDQTTLSSTPKRAGVCSEEDMLPLSIRKTTNVSVQYDSDHDTAMPPGRGDPFYALDNNSRRMSLPKHQV